MTWSARGLQQHGREVRRQRLLDFLLALAETELQPAVLRPHHHQPGRHHVDRARGDVADEQGGHAKLHRKIGQIGQCMPRRVADLHIADPEIERPLPPRPGQQGLGDFNFYVWIDLVEAVLER